MRDLDLAGLWEVERRIRADVVTVFPEFALTFQSYASWSSWQPVASSDLVCHLRGWSFVVPAAGGVEQACFVIADKTQDMIIEDIRPGPWPVVERAGRNEMLSPALDPSTGEARWVGADVSVRVGELSAIIHIQP